MGVRINHLPISVTFCIIRSRFDLFMVDPFFRC